MSTINNATVTREEVSNTYGTQSHLLTQQHYLVDCRPSKFLLQRYGNWWWWIWGNGNGEWWCNYYGTVYCDKLTHFIDPFNSKEPLCCHLYHTYVNSGVLSVRSRILRIQQQTLLTVITNTTILKWLFRYFS